MKNIAVEARFSEGTKFRLFRCGICLSLFPVIATRELPKCCQHCGVILERFEERK